MSQLHVLCNTISQSGLQSDELSYSVCTSISGHRVIVKTADCYGSLSLQVDIPSTIAKIEIYEELRIASNAH